jgi:hypothetical protein
MQHGVSADQNQDNNEENHNLFDTLLPEGTSCLHYSHDYDLGTQVLIVRSSIHKYVSVVYAGTDDFTTALMDGEILMGKFGPTTNITGDGNRSDLEKLFDQVPEDAHVHRLAVTVMVLTKGRVCRFRQSLGAVLDTSS